MKEGLGSLGDFKEFLKEGEITLSEQELFVFTWVLLDNCYCLHKIHYCHRDIKPANIIISPDAFLPELIDYSLASEFSRAQKGNYGTTGYRLEDFETIENKETKWEDHLKSNDYFALGKTMLELAFPTFRIISINNMKSRLEKLKKSNMKILGDMLEICLFGDIQSKENILRKHIKSAEFSFRCRVDKNPHRIWRYVELLKEKYEENFKTFMKEKLKKKKIIQESRPREISNFLISKESQNQTIKPTETKMSDEEEKWILENFRKDPEKAVEKCKKVRDQLFRTDTQIPDSKLLSTLIAVLYLNGCIDDAIDLCDKTLLLDSKVQDFHWAVLNNIAIISLVTNVTKAVQFRHDQSRNFSKLFQHFGSSFINDLKYVFSSMSNHYRVEKNELIELKSLGADNQVGKIIILTFFRMGRLSDSLFFWNYGYVLSSRLDSMIDETVRAKLRAFVSDLHLSGRKSAFKFLKFRSAQSVLFNLVTFCQVFEDLSTDLAELNFLKKEAREIISMKKIWAHKLSNANHRLQEIEILTTLLESELIYVMSGFFILYNIKYHMRPKSYFLEKEPNQIPLSNKEMNDRLREDKAKKNRDKQTFLDSIMSFMMEVSDIKFEYAIQLNSENIPLHKISILGTKLNDLILHQCGSISVKEYGFEYSKKEKSSLIKSLWMECKAPFLEEMSGFLNPSTMNKLQSLERMIVKFCNENQYPSLFTEGEIENLLFFEELSNFFSSLALTCLDITFDSGIRISDQEFRPLSKFISTQVKLEVLIIRFDLSLINRAGIDSFSKDLTELKQLQELSIFFTNCPEIESESIFSLLLSLKKLSELKYVKLKISACSNITFLKKPQDLPFKIDVLISLIDDNHEH